MTFGLRGAFASLLLLSLSALSSGPHATAQTLGMVSHANSFDPSIESAGMGSGSVAVFWAGEPNEWRNPAWLGSVHGIRYSHGTTDLTPFVLAFDRLKSGRLLAGAFGIGVSLNGKGIESVGGLRLDYDRQTVTDVLGTSYTFSAYEEVRSFSVGISALEVLSGTMQLLGSEPIALRERVTISAGHTWKDLIADRGVDPVFFQPWNGEGESRDWGALVRIAPLDQIGKTAREPRDDSAWRIELGGGYCERNYDGVNPEDVVVVLDKEEVYGASARTTVAIPTRIARGWIWDFAAPVFALGVAWDRTEGQTPATYRVDRMGGELSLLDVFYLRHGRIDPAIGDDDTWGFGVALQYRNAVGVRFDWAQVPWANEEYGVDRYGITAFIEPLKFDTSGGLK